MTDDPREIAPAAFLTKRLAERSTALYEAQQEIERLRAEVAALRLTLGSKTFSSDVPEIIGCPIPGACAQVAEIKRLRDVLIQIAAFDDRGGNARLEATGSYSAFDEPGAVEVARKALCHGQ